MNPSSEPRVSTTSTPPDSHTLATYASLVEAIEKYIGKTYYSSLSLHHLSLQNCHPQSNSTVKHLSPALDCVPH